MDRREQMRRWLALREERGLTFRELSGRAGIPTGTLAHWAWKLRRESSVGRNRHPKAASFVELIPTSAAERCEPADPSIEIVLEGGRRVLVRGDVRESALQRVVRALERC